ncbi:MAG: signal peptide peptidase SppA [Planctomycetes bacterium]|nr:signal peptide peptidase SppA [Planctomycetota bacterium]
MREKTSSWISLGIFLVIFTGAPGFARLSAQEEKPEPPKKVLRLTIRGQAFEGEPPFQLFGNIGGSNLRDLTAAVRQAAKDDKVAALVLRLKNPLLGMAQRQALRRALLEFRKCGKPSFCHLAGAGGGDYLLASACAEVSLIPTGFLEIPGLGMELIHFKGLLDKLGIRFEELRMGKYKSAAEPFTRESPSEAVREEMQSLLDELYDDFVEGIAANRGRKPVEVRALIDRALFNAPEAKEAALVDRLEYEDEFLARITKKEGKPLELAEAKLGRQLNLEITGFAGLMNLFSELFGGGRRGLATKNPKLAVIAASGPIIASGDAGALFGGEMITAGEMVKLFRKVQGDESVKAVVFRIDSPGGSALASDLIWREVKATKEKKPVVVSMGDMAASGGYYIACPATTIFADRSTLTGSIGVIGAVPSVRGLCDKIGISLEGFYRGKRADMISPYGDLTDDGRELILKSMRTIYSDFIAHVAEGRSLSKEAVASIAEGRVWTGGQALKHGLVDALGGLDDAMEQARKLGGLSDEAEVMTLPKAKTFIDLLQDLSAEGAALRAALEGLPPEIRRLVRQLEWVNGIQSERVQAVLPEVIRIR